MTALYYSALVNNLSSNTVTTAVQKSGDVMTGPLILYGNPSSSTEAATKNYVDSSVTYVVANITPTLLNDISNQFDGTKATFPLLVDQTSITTIDSKDLEVFIDGLRISPYINRKNFPWVVVYDSFNGYRIRNSSITIYKAPFIGQSCTLLFRYNSHQTQTVTYPFTATTIALGD